MTDSSGAVDFAKMCKDSGADFITVHFRTRAQMYSGVADYALLPQIAKVGVPVFANGDVSTREQYLQLTEMGACGVAVGRGALGKPHVFAELAGNSYEFDLLDTVTAHTKMLLKTFSDRVVANEMKKHVSAYLKGKRNAKPTAIAVNSAHTTQEILDLVNDFVTGNPEYKVVKQQ